MGEMREWWANVRLYEGPWAGVGNRRETREACEAATALSPVLPAYRLHVRLKPEGAPRRYASPHDRWCWENNPKRAAALDELFAMDLPFERANEGGGDTA